MKALFAYGGVLMVALALPILVVVIGSLTAGDRIAFPPEGVSLRWYRAFLDSPEFIESARTSLEIAGLTSLVSGIAGGLAALGLARTRFRGGGLVETLLTLPLAIPSIALGLACLIFYTALDLAGSKLALGLRAYDRDHAVRHSAGARQSGGA
ncbi:MAG: hypothetical protein WDO24_20130 [Pseudomonadota bacterium]